ncbi:chromosomal replication initiator protein DnaA [uncultured Sphaerotilus sp.]|uniref:chromosomal replication initiator protein DnaA n=1 Tax=uncultured Sphaerotilus sp. TaxID=474984 RepID=UPI0030CA1DAB
MHLDLWQRGCERLAAELPAQQFNTWFRPLPPAQVSAAGEGYLVGLRVPNRFKMDWIRSQFAARIERLLSEIAGKPVRLELSLGQGGEPAPAPAPLAPEPPPPPAAPVQMSMIDFLPLPLPTETAPPAPATARATAPRARSRASGPNSAAAGLLAPVPDATPALRAGRTPSSMPGLHELLTLPVGNPTPPVAAPSPKPAARAPSRRSAAAAEPAAPVEPPPEPPAAPVAAPLSSSAISAASALAKASAAVASRRKRVAGTKAAEAAAAPPPVAAAPAPAPSSPYPGAGAAAGSSAFLGGAPTIIIPTVPPPMAPSNTRGRINPALTFDTLVPGRANQMARTAAMHVVSSPGGMYNPLFLYGGVGLGKTHLIHAVGNALLKEHKDARVLYLHAEQFISDVVRNYQRKTFDELKAKYHSLDLLLIDDVQFFAGKDRTQEEFFNAFEALLTKRAHIIMTSDTYPKGLVDIDERLTSRFDAGLTVAIEPPELEMRVAILMKKSVAEGSQMPEDVAFFIAKNVRANVRELEGALRKVLAYSRFSHKDINIALAREALKDLLSIQNRQISVENIQKTVADFYKIKIGDMYSKKRPASIARPRQIAMYLAKEMTQKSLPEIGDLFGGRDHTTVLYAVRKIAAERQKNTELNQQLHVLEQTLKG